MSLFNAKVAGSRRWLRVGDAYEITKKPRGLDTSSLAAIPFVPMAAIPQGGAYAPNFTLKEPAQITSGTYFERGDILIAKITPSFENGKQALATEIPAPLGYATTEVFPLRPRGDGYDRRLLFFYLLHPDIRHHVAERMEGTTGRQRVPEDVILDLPYPEFALKEQTAISEALELIQRGIAAEARSIHVSTDLKRATMRELFTRGLRGEAQKETEIGPMPESWVIEPINEHFSVVSGGTPSRRIPVLWTDGTIPWVKTTEINYGVILETEERITQAGLDQSAAKLLPSGTLLLAMYGQGVTRGKVAILGIKATCNQACAAINSDDDLVDTKYLYHFLSFRYEAIRRLAHGGQQQNLNLEIVRSLPVACPANREEQSKIVAILDAIDRKIDLHHRKRAVLNDLFKALLHKLMTGEISVFDLDLSPLPFVLTDTTTGRDTTNE